MKPTGICACHFACALWFMMCAAVFAEIEIKHDFPGGNIVLEKIEGDQVRVHQDLRDTKGDWFYWYFAVKGAQGRDLTFHFTRSRALGLIGPGISRDGGKTWQWLGSRMNTTSFRYRFGAEEEEVRFSFGMPYQHADLMRFLEKHQIKAEILGKTKKGIPVELLRLGSSAESAKFKVLVTVRHHACEMMASYVAEGFIEEFLGSSETGRWLREQVQCIVVPLVDKDGVEAGDQGKNRVPHDHKADYRGKSIYPEIAALRELVASWAGGWPDATLDLHNPTLSGQLIYTHALRKKDAAQSAEMHFLTTLERAQRGPLEFRVQDSVDFADRMAREQGKEKTAGEGTGTEPKDSSPVQGRKDITVGFEVPYAMVRGKEVTPDSARAFGRHRHSLVRAPEDAIYQTLLMNRRYFLESLSSSLVFAGGVPSALAAAMPKAPFRLLYSNDLTNITGCTSPFHKAKEPFRKEMLEAAVDEVAGTGVDAHLLQPGLGVLPMWKSKVQPLEEHAAWLKETFGQSLDRFSQFVVDGNDLVQIFIDRCRMRGQAPFVSIRMNDAHHKENIYKPKGEKIGSVSMSINRFYHEHPEYRLVLGSPSGKDTVLNWAEPEVRAQKLALLTELCELYDLEGLELDFLRNYSYFRLAETTREQRAAIMTGFVKDVRAMLERTAREGQRRWLSVRVPCYLEAHDPLGIDLKAMRVAGVDMVNASSHYFTTQQQQVAAIRKQAPDAALYFELCHTIWKGEKLLEGYDVFPFRRATREHLHTAAHLAYARGADGISLFNFPYYRQHGQGEGRGTFGEPPFDALKALADRAALARQPQHWFIASGWRAPGMKPLQVPRKIVPATPAKFFFDLAPPQGGWQRDARLRIQLDKAASDSSWSAMFNGEPLAATPDVSEPFAVPYPSMMGKPEELRAWAVPAKLLAAGINRLELTQQGGGEVSVVFLDLACPNPI